MPETVTLEHYQVLTREDGSLHELGHGAMGITYKGFDTMLCVPVALKVINAAHLHSESARQRFILEARSAAKLRHPNVASIFHLGEDDGNYFYVMEYIDGETVEALVRRQGPLQPAVALRMAAQVARALNAAQRHDLVHRDIKPSNLMAVLEDDDLVIKVIDFGLAKVLFRDGENTGASLTQGGFLGTPHFTSPEQLSELETDARSDIYSLGVTLWYLLRGSPPFGGSLARVIGQQLSREPPFEELGACPSTVVELLRRMLAKDPAERPQSPAELRKEIEQCLRLLEGSSRPAHATVTPDLPVSAPAPLLTPTSDAVVRFETGATIGGRYSILREVGENEAGTTFLARDAETTEEVRLLLLHRELVADEDSFAQLERETGGLTALAHPNVIEVFGLTKMARHAFLTLAWINGFTLRQLLRTRRELPSQEVCRLLGQAAAGLDDAIPRLPRLELGLHHVSVHFPEREGGTDDLLSLPIDQWPAFVVKINPLATWRELFVLTWAAGQTLVGGAVQHERQSRPARAAALQSFGALAYEMLGGVASGYSALTYTPLAALDEAGNAVLRQALVAPEFFDSATDFVRQLAAPAGKLPMTHAARTAPATVAPAAIAPPATVPKPIQVTAPIPEQPAVPQPVEDRTPVPSRGRGMLVALAGVLVIAAAGYALHRSGLFRKPPAPTLVTTTPVPATPGAGPRVAQLQTPTPATPFPTPVPITPRPSTPRPPPPTPTPPPTRNELASNVRRTAEAFEAKQKPREALAAWLDLATDYPEFDAGRHGVEMLLDRLRRRPGGLTRAEFTSMEGDIKRAAQLGILAGMMILGDEWRIPQPTQAFAWYCAAAQGGEPEAMTNAGLMLTNGDGTPRDMRKAVAYFQAAAEKDQAAAMTLLAECYLEGQGVAQDKAHAIGLLEKASGKGNARAMNRLGFCHHKGIGVTVNHREAFRLFSEAAERGSAEAIGNVGTLYMKGMGVEQNAAKAVSKFKEASLKGDPNSMYYYAQCLENSVGVKGDSSAAKSWYQKSAATGHAGAIEWCKAQGVSFNGRGR